MRAGRRVVVLPPPVDRSTLDVNGSDGNINGSTDAYWRAKVYSETPAVAPTRDLMLKYIAGTALNSGGEMPVLDAWYAAYGHPALAGLLRRSDVARYRQSEC